MINCDFSLLGKKKVPIAGTNQLFRIMKLTSFLLIVLCMHVGAASRSQTVSLNAQNRPLSQVLESIEKQTELMVVYNDRFVDPSTPVSIRITDAPLTKVLESLLNPVSLSYHITEGTIVITGAPPKDGKKKLLQPVETQQRIVKGRVTDQQENPLDGVTVSIKETTAAVTTDAGGNYRIVVPESGNTLVFTIVGFEPAERSIGNQSTIDVMLKTWVSNLDEVVVVGYGTQAKKELTGSVSTVSGAELTGRSVSNLSIALQGAVPGLSVTRSGSAPGSSGSILLRGITTLEGSSDPLILVDDVPVGSIDDVNPDQIESISVLKDGASAAIYGSRAAAGVIIITTKRAKNNAFSFSYSGEQIINSPTTKPDVVSATRYMEIYNEYMWNDAGNGTDRFPAYSEELIANYSALNQENPDQYPITHWPNLILNFKRPSIGLPA